jgi:hypothetical protein
VGYHFLKWRYKYNVQCISRHASKNFLLQFPPQKKIQLTPKRNDWITSGIRTSCRHKRELYVASKSNPKLHDHYNKYCKILSSIINEAKKLAYSSKIKKSIIPNKTLWDIIKMETGKTNSTKNDIIDKLQIGDELVNDYKIIAETFNKYFLAIAETIAVNNNFNACSTNNGYITTPTQYLYQSFNCTFPNFKLMPLSTKDTRNIIKSLNTKNLRGYDEISTKLLKLVLSFSVH